VFRIASDSYMQSCKAAVEYLFHTSVVEP